VDADFTFQDSTFVVGFSSLSAVERGPDILIIFSFSTDVGHVLSRCVDNVTSITTLLSPSTTNSRHLASTGWPINLCNVQI